MNNRPKEYWEDFYEKQFPDFLNKNDILTIRSATGFTVYELALQYAISQEYVKAIKNNVVWADILTEKGRKPNV